MIALAASLAQAYGSSFGYPSAAEPERGVKTDSKAAAGHRLMVTTVGGIYSGAVAEDVIQQNKADACYAGRWFQKNPGLVWQFAEELGVQITQARQIEWGFFGRGVGRPQ